MALTQTDRTYPVKLPARFSLFECARTDEPSWQSQQPVAYRAYRNDWQQCPEQKLVRDYPVHIDIELTNRCNLKCPMCRRTELGAKGMNGIGDMEWSVFQSIIDECAGKVHSVKLNFRGEPLLYPQLVDAVAYAKRKGFVEVMLNSNAVLLDDAISRRLLDAGLDLITFSFDHPTKEAYEQSRPGAIFEQTRDNILKFCDIRKNGGYSAAHTRINALKTDAAEHDALLLHNIFGNAVDEINLFDHHLQPSDFTPSFEQCARLMPEISFSCESLWQRIGFLYDGAVMMCCSIYENTPDAGTIHTSSVHELRHSRPIRPASRSPSSASCSGGGYTDTALQPPRWHNQPHLRIHRA